MPTECSYRQNAEDKLAPVGQVRYNPQGWPFSPPRLPVAPLPGTRRPEKATGECVAFRLWCAKPDVWHARYRIIFAGKVPTNDVDIDEFRCVYNITQPPTDPIDLDSFIHMLSQAKPWWA